MVDDNRSQPSRHGTDHDGPYTFGRPPSMYLNPHQVVRLTILRSRLRDRPLNEPPGGETAE